MLHCGGHSPCPDSLFTPGVEMKLQPLSCSRMLMLPPSPRCCSCPPSFRVTRSSLHLRFIVHRQNRLCWCRRVWMLPASCHRPGHRQGYPPKRLLGSRVLTTKLFVGLSPARILQRVVLLASHHPTSTLPPRNHPSVLDLKNGRVFPCRPLRAKCRPAPMPTIRLTHEKSHCLTPAVALPMKKSSLGTICSLLAMKRRPTC